MLRAEHSILLMSKIEFCRLMSLQSVRKHSRVVNTQRERCKHSIFLSFFFFAFLFALTASWWLAKSEEGGMQIPGVVTAVDHIKIQSEHKQLTV